MSRQSDIEALLRAVIAALPDEFEGCRLVSRFAEPLPGPDEWAFNYGGTPNWQPLASMAGAFAAILGESNAQAAADAARYRWLRDGNAFCPEESGVCGGEALDVLCDAGITADRESASEQPTRLDADEP